MLLTAGVRAKMQPAGARQKTKKHLRHSDKQARSLNFYYRFSY